MLDYDAISDRRNDRPGKHRRNNFGNQIEESGGDGLLENDAANRDIEVVSEKCLEHSVLDNSVLDNHFRSLFKIFSAIAQFINRAENVTKKASYRFYSGTLCFILWFCVSAIIINTLGLTEKSLLATRNKQLSLQEILKTEMNKKIYTRYKNI
ncbi:unnamed protein product [Adineta steineri]|uniref:Uncharacterized protein n=1 Tax=Adineta steineri TaxID=433720 RepID=A0A814H6A4_9BILA|nr:unnamed protein product [Adineta steineri]CAF1230988.1 unnamed protein product [Adineta steineri]